MCFSITTYSFFFACHYCNLLCMDFTHVESKNNHANTCVYDTRIDKVICSRVSHPYTIGSLTLLYEYPLNIMTKRGGKESELQIILLL